MSTEQSTAHRTSDEYDDDESVEDVNVTSPNSYARRESMRRSMSAGGGSSSTQAFLQEAQQVHDRQPNRISFSNLLSRAPPPPPPNSTESTQDPPPRPSMTRPSSNPSLSGMVANQSSPDILNLPSQQQQRNSLGPNNAWHSSKSSSNVSALAPGSGDGNASGHRRSSSRRSLFKMDLMGLKGGDKEVSSIPENVSSEIICEGYLTKRGHVFTNWKTRYFVLRGNVLEYFADESKSKRYGMVTVANVAPWTGVAHGFMFHTSKQIPYYVYAASESEKNKWMRALGEFYDEPEEVSCEGYLTKRGHLVPSQRMAYYVLNGTSLKQYVDQQAYRENQSAVSDVDVRSVAPWDGESNGLMFQTITGNVFYASADTVGEQQKWLASVKRATANIPEPVACAGYLTKQGHKRKSWKKRYFVLRGHVISYFADYDMANNSRGKPLAEVTVEDVQKWDGEPFGFMFMTSEQVPYYVYADNDRERSKWMNALRKLNAVHDEPEVAKKRCPNCDAVLTGSRFCGACGQNLRGTGLNDRATAAIASSVQGGSEEKGMTRGQSEEMDDGDMDDENTAFDELEALSEGARTLLLAVMQTPDGIDVGGDKDAAYPSRLARQQEAETVENESEASEEGVEALEPVDEPREVEALEPVDKPREVEAKALSESSSEEEAQRPFTIQEPPQQKSFTSFSDDEEEKQPLSASRKTLTGTVSAQKKRLADLANESSSDEEEKEAAKEEAGDNLRSLKSNRPSVAVEADEKDESSGEERGRKSSEDSLELDTRGIAGFDEPQPVADPVVPSLESKVPASDAKKDIYHCMEKELDFTPQFVPSPDSPVRCRFYTSMAYASAKKVILFLSDSGPMGLWRQDATNASTTIEHPWSMVPYFARAQEEGYGVIVCNPFSNSAVVYEAGGFERVVPIPNSSTPEEHVRFVWEHFVAKCRGQVSIIAFAQGGTLAKSIVEAFEDDVREKVHRIAFIESKHEIDGNESPSVLELLGRRAINWECAFESLGAQIVDSQARVGCVCLSIGFMPPNKEADSAPVTLEKAERAAFAFVGANPERPGMTAVVKHVRAELRKRKSGRARRKSNILVLGETDADEASDMSAGGAEEETKVSAVSPDEKSRPSYYLPNKPLNKAASKESRKVESDKTKAQITVKDFELMKVVGQGGFGKVFLSRKLTPPRQGEAFAMKVLKKQHVVSSGLVNTTMAERKILTEIHHPFIVKLHYAFQSDSKLYLVMDYLSGGSLAFHLRRRRKFREDWARFYAAEVAAGIAHLHSLDIIYRDAKLENVLLDHEGHVRITDFGLSKVGVSDLKGATTFCGTAAYIAPELLKGNSYGKAADWWSFGILLYEMIGGKPPYYHRNRDIMFQTILKQEWVTFTPSFSDKAVSLIRGLLTRDPMMRLGSGPSCADEVLNHPFFESMNWQELLEKRIEPPFNPGVGKLDTHYAPRHNNDITTRDREGTLAMPRQPQGAQTKNDFDGFSFVGRPSSLSNA